MSTEVRNRPNILYVFADQLSARWLGCYGHPVVQTPSFDRFAGQGMRFERAYTSSPLCTPYRGALFTGRYPTQTGVTENDMSIPDGEVTLPGLLSAAGYDTAYVGKWHLSGSPQANRWVPPDKRIGFRRFVGWESCHVDHWQGRIWADDPDQPLVMPGHETDALTDITISELAARQNQPFAMFLSYQAPHPPCSPPKEFRQMYANRDLFTEPNADADARYNKPGWNAVYSGREFRERHFGEISHLDSAFGRLMDALETMGLADNTLVFLTSDHGEMNACHGLFGKSVMYDEAIRVPLIVRGPGMRTGVTEHAAATVDTLPTILELCGAPAHPTAEGKSFAGLLRGLDEAEPGRTVFSECGDLRAAVSGRWKLVTDRSGNPVQFFDMASDPYELTDLHAAPEYAGPRDAIRQEVADWLVHVSA